MGDRRRLVVVGHSLGAFTAPLVSARLPVELLVLLAGMIPSPGELFSDWWKNVGFESSGYDDVFYHDVPPSQVQSLADVMIERVTLTAGRRFDDGWAVLRTGDAAGARYNEVFDLAASHIRPMRARRRRKAGGSSARPRQEFPGGGPP